MSEENLSHTEQEVISASGTQYSGRAESYQKTSYHQNLNLSISSLGKISTFRTLIGNSRAVARLVTVPYTVSPTFRTFSKQSYQEKIIDMRKRIYKPEPPALHLSPLYLLLLPKDFQSSTTSKIQQFLCKLTIFI